MKAVAIQKNQRWRWVNVLGSLLNNGISRWVSLKEMNGKRIKTDFFFKATPYGTILSLVRGYELTGFVNELFGT